MIGHYNSPLGWIEYETSDDALVKLSFVDEPRETHLIKNNVFDVLNDYFSQHKKTFDIDIKFEKGTPFQKEVWQELLKIPYGRTRSYQEIATLIGRPKALTAVGQACKRNPVGIIVPCHRVIGKNNQMRGYSGKDYIDLKIALLNHENANIKPR
jgi:O-6-methylguanine DNA methyltransferase